MKTSEFKRELKKIGDYEFDDNYVLTASGSWILFISSKNRNTIDTEGAVFDVSDELFKLVCEYAATPIKEREDEKRYYIHVIKFAYGYLNLNKNNYDADYVLNTSDVTEHYKTIFTESEIEEMKCNPNLAIDWNKALEPVEEADDGEN